MAITFYPHSEDLIRGSVLERLEILTEAAERFKSIVLDATSSERLDKNKKLTPRDLHYSYNWEEIAKLLREIKEMPELNKTDKALKADLLLKLAEVYEILRAAKMAKLEAVRLALVAEANHLSSKSL